MATLRDLSIWVSPPIREWCTNNRVRIPAYLFDYFSYAFCPQKGASEGKLLLRLSERDFSQSDIEFETQVDLSAIVAQDEQGRDECFLSAIERGLKLTKDAWKLSEPEITRAANDVRSGGYYFHGLILKPAFSKDRRRSVELVGTYRDSTEVLVRLRNKGVIMKEQFLACGKHGFHFFVDACKKLRWIDSRFVEILQSNGRDYWTYDTDSNEVEFHFVLAERGEPQGIYRLGCFYFNGEFVRQDAPRGIELIQKSASLGYKHAIRFMDRLNSGNGLQDMLR